jgi:glycosyltransferase involved in cell wall biosynthesis
VKLTRDYANRCDCVVVPSAGIKQVLVTYGVTARIEVIPTGVDLAWAGGGEPAPIRQRWGIPREAPLIVYAGRVALEKNIDLLVEGFARLARGSFPGAHLLLVGGGPWDRATLERARRLGVADRVHLAGYLPREEVFRCYAEADLLAFPSLTDTQGLVVLEAMAMGTPPVAVRSSAVEGLISPGEDGVLVEAKPEALARAMGELLADPGRRRELGARAREKARAFSAESCARRLAEVYRELVEQRQGKAGRGGKERAGSR